MCELHDHQGLHDHDAVTSQPDVGRRHLLRGAGGLILGGGLVVAGASAAHAATSQNGWPASSSPSAIGITALSVSGHSFPAGVRGGQVHTILGYVAQRFNNEVEALVTPGCWGYNYREISGSTSLSNHASGTAIDCNAPRHPLGASGTFSSTQVSRIRSILTYCNGVVRWGGDYSSRKDEMHFEINVAPGDSRIAPLVSKIGGTTPPPPTTTWSTVSSGATGFRVVAIQHLLRARGQSLTVDGVFGDITVSRVRAFQTSRGLAADGVVGPNTWSALVVTVKSGSSGEAVVAAQKTLTARGYACTADGIFGATTTSQAKAFQSSRGLVADGIVGPATWAKLTF
ncbi:MULTISPECIES: peptidoglycan-binding protein [unclassified Knoellia]|uniref:peptidoglycan-binding protein n=1 Tax=Knoellia altitudinis TaxID=3404795 RepID=UPI0036178A49